MRGKAKPAKGKLFHLGCYQNILFTFGVDLPTSGKVIKIISQVAIPIQVTLICSQLTLKASLNIRHVSTDVIRKQIKTSVDRRQPRVLQRIPDSYLPFVISREMQTCKVVHRHRELVIWFARGESQEGWETRKEWAHIRTPRWMRGKSLQEIS